ncbi:hypothetical protein KSF_001740 [Reticulibacter mediterranei]|uniref:DUF1963 domain-containing protein n=1 Tax=Reticulibacter mediterranei TaxID=2778369 RepID=A0A8J3II95_9CHLR|nr:DUF1963 domain-containing protein [Reticulibacter mediterranei]GHO90126.1 hypothetical protein KSF_001740 [Reticulibacter mediterranei]
MSLSWHWGLQARGLPDLPPGLEWPAYEGRPFKLLAQIRLADVAPYDLAHELPPTGMLSFFLDSSPEAYPYISKENQRVIYYDGDLSQLRRRSAPAAENFRFTPRTLTFSSRLMLPPSRFL